MDRETIIGIDLGASNVRAGLVKQQGDPRIVGSRIRSQGRVEEVLEDLYALLDPIVNQDVSGIGIGVPSVVDEQDGIVYDVQYIPSWKEVHLKKILENRYRLPVRVNNDANCFAVGEHIFGKGKGFASMIGLTIGTGLGAGIILNNKLYAGKNCGAGEFGMVDYLDRVYEYYASGSFFQNVHHVDGQFVHAKAMEGETWALNMYSELGSHLGNAIKMILYTYDVELIILGGSVRHAYPFFSDAMWERIRTFAYPRSVERLRIEISELQNSGVLGAAGLLLGND